MVNQNRFEYSQRKNVKNNVKKEDILKAILYLITYFTLGYILSVLLFDILYPNVLERDDTISKILIGSIIVLFISQSISAVIINYLTLVVYKRTKYKMYIFEGLIYILGSILLLLATIYFISNAFFFPLFLFVDSFFLQYPLLKKPLIWDSQYNRQFLDFKTTKKSDIILRQSMYITENEDGYTTRPMFLDISDLFNEERERKYIQEQSLQFAKFLACNGDLIGYDQSQNKLNLYIRTSYLRKTDIGNPISIFKKVNQVISKQDLTMITFDFDLKEMDFKMNKKDYEGLDDVTYHQLVERILKQFKFGLEKFLEKDYLNSYESVMPENIKSRSLILDDYLIAIFLIGYFVGLIFIGLPVVFFANIENNIGYFGNSLLAIGWPLVSFFGAQYAWGSSFNSSNDSRLMIYFPIMLILHLITFFVTLGCYFYLLITTKHKQNSPLKGLILPFKDE